jgi:CheY-like chemotaxis protein
MTFRLLHVDDSPADVELIADALQELGVDVSLSSVGTGTDALAVLSREGRYADMPLPHLVLLDLNLPQKNGREVLAALKADAALRSLPVVVLTTSNADDDVHSCYALGANAYLRKPVGLKAVRESVAALRSFWIESNVYPRLER